jgi:hypothetical protein
MTDVVDKILSDPAVGAIGLALGIGLVALWLAAAWWTYLDAGRRSESGLARFIAAGWIVLSSPALLPLSLPVYLLARPQVPAADSRARDLAWELATATHLAPECPACGERVDEGWRRCPTCTEWLAAPCPTCRAWSARALPACPFCGTEGHAEPVAPRRDVLIPRRVARSRGSGMRLARRHRDQPAAARPARGTADGQPASPVRVTA